MDDFQSTPLVNTELLRKTYQVTYSHGSLARFPTRKILDECIKKYFNTNIEVSIDTFTEITGKVRVQH